MAFAGRKDPGSVRAPPNELQLDLDEGVMFVKVVRLVRRVCGQPTCWAGPRIDGAWVRTRIALDCRPRLQLAAIAFRRGDRRPRPVQDNRAL